MRKHSSLLLGVVVLLVVGFGLMLVLVRREPKPTAQVTTTLAPKPAAKPAAPTVLDDVTPVDEPRTAPTVVLAPERETVTKPDEAKKTDSANLGPVTLIQPTADERARLEEKMTSFLNNQADARAGQSPR